MAKAKPALKLDPRIALIDELGNLDRELAPFADKLKRRDALKKTVRAWPLKDQLAGEASVLYTGAAYIVALGACENERALVSLSKVKDELGLPWLLTHAKVTLKDLEEALPAGIDHLVAEARTGSRSITILKTA